MKLAVAFHVLAVLMGGGLLFTATDGFRAVTTEGARRIGVAENPTPVPDIVLESMDGEAVPLRPVRNEIVLVEFIYTTCPVVCQEAAIDFAAIRDRLGRAGAAARLLSISFDPLRDDPAALKDYGEAHGADGRFWTVARPDPAELDELLESFGVTVIPDEWLGYQHNAAIHVVDGAGRLVAIHDTDAVRDVVDRVLASHE